MDVPITSDSGCSLPISNFQFPAGRPLTQQSQWPKYQFLFRYLTRDGVQRSERDEGHHGRAFCRYDGSSRVDPALVHHLVEHIRPRDTNDTCDRSIHLDSSR